MSEGSAEIIRQGSFLVVLGLWCTTTKVNLSTSVELVMFVKLGYCSLVVMSSKTGNVR